ncbi:hypothetical protein Tco_1266731, partial [Tanacetum coccineum]
GLYVLSMKRDFLSQKGSEGGRDVKEKNQVSDNVVVKGVVDGKVNRSTATTIKVTEEPSRKSVNFHTLLAQAENKADVVITLESIRAISERFANTVYDFFLGKWVAYPIVDNYVRNTWSKSGLVKSMFNSSNGFFFFKFSFKDGKDAIL